MHPQLDKLHACLASDQLEPAEREHILRDLQAMTQRIQAGEYRHTDFVARSTFDIPRRTAEFFRYFAGYQEQAERLAALLKAVPMAGITSITDLCPGWAPKIEMALLLAGFQGDVYLFDKSRKYAAQLEIFLRILRPAFRTLSVQGDLLTEAAPPRTQLVIANHIVDDLIIDLYVSQAGLSADALYGCETTFIRSTSEIPEVLDADQIAVKLATALNRFVLPRGYLILTHYLSVTESCLDLHRWADYTADVFLQVQQVLYQQGYQQLSGAGAGTIVLQAPHSAPQ